MATKIDSYVLMGRNVYSEGPQIPLLPQWFDTVLGVFETHLFSFTGTVIIYYAASVLGYW
jgi:hypothetical protein